MEGESAQDERASVKGEFLSPFVVLLSYEVDGLGFPEAMFGNIDFRKERVDPREIVFGRLALLET
jgi:hypothetical protein